MGNQKLELHLGVPWDPFRCSLQQCNTQILLLLYFLHLIHINHSCFLCYRFSRIWEADSVYCQHVAWCVRLSVGGLSRDAVGGSAACPRRGAQLPESVPRLGEGGLFLGAGPPCSSWLLCWTQEHLNAVIIFIESDFYTALWPRSLDKFSAGGRLQLYSRLSEKTPQLSAESHSHQCLSCRWNFCAAYAITMLPFCFFFYY